LCRWLLPAPWSLFAFMMVWVFGLPAITSSFGTTALSRLPPAPALPAALGAEPRDCARLKPKADHAA
jgi:hypothetical protein